MKTDMSRRWVLWYLVAFKMAGRAAAAGCVPKVGQLRNKVV